MKRRPEIQNLLSTAQRQFLLIQSLAGQLGFMADRQIREILRMISRNPSDTQAVNEATNAALSIMRASPQFCRTVFDQNPFRYTRGRAAGSIVFAREFDRIAGRVYPVGLSLTELLQNMIITGRAGAGKTTTIFAIIENLHRLGIPFWWIDFKQDGRHLIRSVKDLVVLRPDNFKLNPLVPPREGIAYKWLQIFVNILFDALFPGGAEASRSFFMDLLDDLYTRYGVYEGSACYPSLYEVDYMLDEKNPANKRRTRTEREKMRVIRNRLHPMLRMMGDMFDCSQGFMCKELLQTNVVFEFDGLAPEYQKFLINLIFHWTFTYRIEGGMRNHSALILIFDEAKKVYAGATGTSVLSELTSMAREFKVGLVVADQMPHVLGDAIKDNVYTTIALSQSSPKNVNEMAAMLGLNAEEKNQLKHLPVGRAIVKFNG